MNYLANMPSMIGSRIRLKRKELKMTQKDLASFIGVTFQQLQKYESGQSNISINMLIKICKIFNVNITYFISKNECQTIAMSDTSKQIDYQSEKDLEKRLLEIFRLIKNKQVKKSILTLLESIATEK